MFRVHYILTDNGLTSSILLVLILARFYKLNVVTGDTEGDNQTSEYDLDWTVRVTANKDSALPYQPKKHKGISQQ